MDFLSSSRKKAPISLQEFQRYQKVIQSYFKKQPVALAFLHGSLAKDQFKPLSDIDIAILFSTDQYSFQKFSEIRTKICDILNREDVDLAILNKASPLFCMNVLVKGKLLYCQKKQDLIVFRKKTFHRYLSTNDLRKKFYGYQRQAILGGS